MAVQRTFFKNFGGGINDNTPANQLKDNQIVEALNFEFDKQNNLRSRQGVNKFNPNRNLLTRTEEFDHADWIVYDGSISRNANVSKDINGLMTGDGIGDSHVTIISSLGQSKSCLNNENYTFSIYIKSDQNSIDGYPAIGIRFLGGATPIESAIQFANDGLLSNVYGKYIQKNGNVGFVSATVEAINATGSYPNDSLATSNVYHRVSITVQNNASGNNIVRPIIYPCTIPAFSGNWGTGAFIGVHSFWGAQLERGKKLTPYKQNISSASGAIDVLNKFTSIYQFNKEDGTNGIFTTAGNKIYRYDSNLKQLVDATGGLTLPSDTYWQWITYQDIAIGVNRANTASGATNPVKISSTTGSAVALGGSPPKGRFIELWNYRVWIISEDDPSTIKCSSLGLPENYTNTGKAGSQAYDIGLEITGIKATKDRLFLFTKNSIYYIMAGSPNTDIEQYEIKLLSAKIGCLSAYSIQIVLDDVIFLSNFGLASIAAVQDFGDFESVVLSKNIYDLNNFQVAADNSASVVYSSKSQYYLALPLGVNSTHNKCFILDFTGIQEKEIGFTTADGKLLGACFSEVVIDNKRRLLIGGYPDSDNENLAFIYLADEPNIFNDDTVAYTQRIKTKAYDLEAFATNKVFVRTLFEINLLSENVSLNWSYRINEKEELTKTWPMVFINEILSGAIYDVDKYDEAKFAVIASPFKTIQRRIIGDPGRIGQSIQFILELIAKDNGIVLKGYGFDFKLITSRRLVGG